jgi:hypothetical protein
MMSGGPIDLSRFRRGWVVPAGLWRAHYMDRSELTTKFRSRCGSVKSNGALLFYAGDFARCKHCTRDLLL